MKQRNRIYIALAVILIASLGCTAQGTAPSAGGGQPGTEAAAAPSQPAGNIDDAPVPEAIDLSNPALYIVPDAPAYKYDSALKITGVDTAGGPKEFDSYTLLEVQTQPQIMQHILYEGDLMGASPSDAPGSISIPSSDTVIIGDQMTSAQMVGISGAPSKLVCHTGPTSSMQGTGLLESTLDSMPKLQTMLTGQAQGVESGVEVNGFMTDKYELSGDNFTEGQDKPISAFVYVARDGGFIARFEEQFQTKMAISGFDPNQVAEGTLTLNYFLAEDGSLAIAVPVECNQ
jgi:hypothetical protein